MGAGRRKCTRKLFGRKTKTVLEAGSKGSLVQEGCWPGLWPQRVLLMAKNAGRRWKEGWEDARTGFKSQTSGAGAWDLLLSSQASEGHRILALG